MGSQVIAICKCGVNTKILVGGGKQSFKVIDYFPGYCSSCKEVVQINLKNVKLTCPFCENNTAIPYNNSNLIGNNGEKVVAQSFINVLTNGTYYCPHCNNMTLNFLRDNLHWD